MNRHIEKAKELRSPQKCYNCAETIMMAYADDLGLTESQAECLGCNFGGGMKCGGTCGAITGGLMVLGALGVSSPGAVGAFQRTIRDNHALAAAIGGKKCLPAFGRRIALGYWFLCTA